MVIFRILTSDKPVTKNSRFSANICKWGTPYFISFFADFCLPPLTHFSFRRGDLLPAICNKTDFAFPLACRMWYWPTLFAAHYDVVSLKKQRSNCSFNCWPEILNIPADFKKSELGKSCFTASQNSRTSYSNLIGRTNLSDGASMAISRKTSFLCLAISLLSSCSPFSLRPIISKYALHFKHIRLSMFAICTPSSNKLWEIVKL